MVVESILIVVFIFISLLFLSKSEKGVGLLMMSSFGLVITGLYIVNNKVEGLLTTFTVPFGTLITFIGIYFLLKTSIKSLYDIWGYGNKETREETKDISNNGTSETGNKKCKR